MGSFQICKFIFSAIIKGYFLPLVINALTN